MDSPTKRSREETEDEYDDAPPRKRSNSRSPRNGSPAYRLAERPARRYSRDRDNDVDDSADERRYYGRRTPSRSRSPSISRSRSQSNTPPPRKPTALNYNTHLILRGHKRAVSCLRFSPNGLWIASGS